MSMRGLYASRPPEARSCGEEPQMHSENGGETREEEADGGTPSAARETRALPQTQPVYNGECTPMNANGAIPDAMDP
jgi:hypothetical protein